MVFRGRLTLSTCYQGNHLYIAQFLKLMVSFKKFFFPPPNEQREKEKMSWQWETREGCNTTTLQQQQQTVLSFLREVSYYVKLPTSALVKSGHRVLSGSLDQRYSKERPMVMAIFHTCERPKASAGRQATEKQAGSSLPVLLTFTKHDEYPCSFLLWWEQRSRDFLPFFFFFSLPSWVLYKYSHWVTSVLNSELQYQKER